MIDNSFRKKCFQHVYGPVPSRRLGRSLGVDLVPFKTCSFDCIYCQLGCTTNKTIERKEYVSTVEILDELGRKLALDSSQDYIGLAGSGEPTLHSGLGELLISIKKITNTPVAVLTNGSLLWKPEVRDCLMEADLVLPSLDAGDSHLFRAINRPHQDITFERMIEGITLFTKQFRGEVWLEVFLLIGLTETTFEAMKIAEIAKRIAPARIQLNSVHRPPADEIASKVTMFQLLALKDIFRGRVEIISENDNVEVNNLLPSNLHDNDLIALISRRSCSVGDVANGLGIHVNEALKHLEQLHSVGKVKILVSQDKVFYTVDL